MTTDLARQVPQAITDPETGEQIDRTDTPRIADLYRRMKEYTAQWRDAQDWCRDALIDAADERHEWTFTIDGVQVKVDPPTAAMIDWDLDELAKLEDLLPPARYAELVQQVVVLKPQTGKLQALARQEHPGSEVAQIIKNAERRKPKQRYVKVNR